MARSRVAQVRRYARTTYQVTGAVRAVQTGRVPQYLINRLIGKAVSRAVRPLWRR
jgi:hypothetical protein